MVWGGCSEVGVVRGGGGERGGERAPCIQRVQETAVSRRPAEYRTGLPHTAHYSVYRDYVK